MESAPQTQAGQALPAAGQAPAGQVAEPAAMQQGVAQVAPQAATAGNPVMAAVQQQQQQQAEALAQQRDANGRFAARNTGTALESGQVAPQVTQPAEAMAVDTPPGQPGQATPQAVPDQQAQQVQQPPQPGQEQTQEQAQQQPPAQPVDPAAQSQLPQAASEAQQQEAIANAMQQAQETIMKQQKNLEDMQKQYTAQMEKMQAQLNEQQKLQEQTQKAKAEQEAQLLKVKQEQQAQAEANKARMLAQLNATMQTIGSSLPNQQFVLPTPPQGEAAKDAAKQSEYEAKLMDTTINTMQALQTQNQAANMEARTNKRTASDALAAGYNFHTGGANNMGAMTTPTAQMGTVNCSRDEAKFQDDRAKRLQVDPSKDKETLLGEQIREWYAAQKANNAKVDFLDCSRQFESMRAHMGSSAVMGTVSCSKGGMWSSSNLVEGNAPSSALCMQQMQPELFDAISDLNPGRIISPAETKAMMDTIQVASAGPRR